MEDISMTASLNTSIATPLSEAVAKTDGPYQLHGLERAVSVLEVLSESEAPLSLAEICHRMNLHKSTAHRSLMVLERSALIERTPENRFRLGLKLYELGNRAVEQIDLRARVYPFFRRLAMDVRETVHLGVLQKTSVVYLDKVEPNRRICMSSKIGSSNPVYCTSMGKAMLAFQPEETIEKIVSSIRFTRYTPKTLCSREKLFKRLETDFAHHPTKCSRDCATCADLLPRNLRLTGYASEEKISRSVAFPDALRQLSHLRFFYFDYDRAEDYSGSNDQSMRCACRHVNDVTFDNR